MNLGSDHQPLSKPVAEKMMNKSESSTKGKKRKTGTHRLQENKGKTNAVCGPHFDPDLKTPTIK